MSFSHVHGSFCVCASQWETVLQCNTISHWLDTYTEWSIWVSATLQHPLKMLGIDFSSGSNPVINDLTMLLNSWYQIHKHFSDWLGDWFDFITASWIWYVKGILPKGPYLPCVSMAGRALFAGYHRCMLHHNPLQWSVPCRKSAKSPQCTLLPL